MTKYIFESNMKIRYLLKKRGKVGRIFIALYQNDQTELISTGETIASKDWSEKDRTPKDHFSDVSVRIEKKKTSILKTENLMSAQEQVVTPLAVKREFLKSLNTKQVEWEKNDKRIKADSKSLSLLIDKWLSESLFAYQVSTQKAVRESLNQFKQFLKKEGWSHIERKELNREIITEYERYLQEVKQLSNSTHGKRIKHLRWFLKHLKFEGFQSIKIRNHRKEIIALSLAELQSLENIDVSDSPEKQKAKDLFLLGCYTGLRISDLKRLNETRIIDGKISMSLKKNKKSVSIPVRPETQAILTRYGMRSPRISESDLNKFIKDVCEAAKINSVITLKVNVAGVDNEREFQKYKLITSHTASKTFITLAPERFGLTPAEIAAVVGKDLKTLLNHYFKLPLKSAIDKMVAAK